MKSFVRSGWGWARVTGALAVGTLLAAAPASAQSVTLRVAKDATVRGGSYANTNFGSQGILETRQSDNATYVRRAVLTFDTETTVPDNATITSAQLILTVKQGNSEARQLQAYSIPVSFNEPEVTWNRRKSANAWQHAGVDVTGSLAAARVTSTPGSRVTFTVTQQVQNVIKGKYGSRYVRFVVGDPGGSSRASYKQYYSGEASNASVRPTLVVTWGSGTSPAPSTSSGTSLKVLQWNVHHGGVGTDGRYDPNRIGYWVAKMRPDIISLNEVDNSSQASALVSAINRATGLSWKTKYSGLGNLVLTRFSVASTSTCVTNAGDNRTAAHLRVIVNGRSVSLWSTHMAVDSSTDRINETRAILSCEQSWPEARVVAGDFNTQAGSTEYNLMAQGHTDAWVKASSLGTASHYLSCNGCTRNSRIDYIFSSKGGTFLTVKSAQVVDTRDSSGHMPSDHKPLLVTYNVK